LIFNVDPPLVEIERTFVSALRVTVELLALLRLEDKFNAESAFSVPPLLTLIELSDDEPLRVAVAKLPEIFKLFAVRLPPDCTFNNPFRTETDDVAVSAPVPRMSRVPL
jgi:hypothetical protein